MRRVLGAGALLVAACAGRFEPKYQATLTAERGEAGAGRASTFAIAPTESLSSETIDIVRSGLEARGMKSVPADRAEVIVGIEYSLGAPIAVSELASFPVFSTYTRPGYVTQRPIGSKNGGMTYTPVTVAATTTEYYLGDRYYCASATVYDKHLRLSARPTGLASRPVPGWDVSVAVRDNVNDAAKYAPILARAAVSQAEGFNQSANPVTLAEGGRKVKARKESGGADQPGLAGGSRVGNYRFVGMPCAENRQVNPATAIREAACLQRPIGLAFPANGSSSLPPAVYATSCVPGVVGKPGDQRWR